MTTYKILIVGFGSIGKKHYSMIKNIYPDSIIKYLRRESFSDYSNPDELELRKMEEVKIFAPNISFICNPASFHIETAISLAKIGSHLFIEKPLSTNLKDISLLKRIINKKRLVLQVGYNLRYIRSLQKIREYIASNKFGKALYFKAVAGQDLKDWRPIGLEKDSISLQKKLGGGVIYELSHEIDYLLWIFGSLDVLNVTKETLFYKSSDVEDYALISLGKRNNRVLSVVGNVTLDFIRKDLSRELEIVCEKATIKWLPLESQIIISNSKKDKVIFFKEDTISHSYKKQMNDFFNNVKANKIPMTSIDEGIKTTKLLIDIHNA